MASLVGSNNLPYGQSIAVSKIPFTNLSIQKAELDPAINSQDHGSRLEPTESTWSVSKLPITKDRPSPSSLDRYKWTAAAEAGPFKVSTLGGNRRITRGAELRTTKFYVIYKALKIFSISLI